MTTSKKFEHPWFLDSRAFHHVTQKRGVFTSLRPSSGTRITTVGGHEHNVIGIGNVAIKFPSREIQKIEHVFYSPSIVKNLLLVGFLTSRGMSLEFTANIYTVKNSFGEIITTATIELDSGLYKLLGETLLHCLETLLHCSETLLTEVENLNQFLCYGIDAWVTPITKVLEGCYKIIQYMVYQE